MKKVVTTCTILALLSVIAPDMVFAQEAHGGDNGLRSLGAAIAIALAALGGTLAQGRAVSTGLEAIGRNPAAAGKMFTPMLLGLVFVETLVIFSFVIALRLS